MFPSNFEKSKDHKKKVFFERREIDNTIRSVEFFKERHQKTEIASPGRKLNSDHTVKRKSKIALNLKEIAAKPKMFKRCFSSIGQI